MAKNIWRSEFGGTYDSQGGPMLIGSVVNADNVYIGTHSIQLPTAEGAPFGSYMDQHESECLPGTRTGLLDHIAKWVGDPQGKCIFWLNGMAGTGKSTISRTVARSLIVKGQLGASFFFKRGEGDRGNGA